MKEWPVGSHLVMESAPIFPDDKPLISIGYKCISPKLLGVIAAERRRIAVPCVPYLFCYPDNYYNVSIRHIFHPSAIGRYSSPCNAIKNQN